MKKFLLGLLSGFVMAGLAAVILVFALMRASDRRPTVPDGTVLVMRLEGAIPELAPVTIPLPWFESQAQSTVADLWLMLRQAAKDDHIKAILLEPRGLGAGWAKLDELRAGLALFKKAGKPVYAYLRNPGAREYYLAAAADKIYFNPEDMLDLKGMRAELTFYRRTLDKMGVEMEIEHAGKYKDAADSYVRTGPTPETREVIGSILDQIFGHLIDSAANPYLTFSLLLAAGLKGIEEGMELPPEAENNVWELSDSERRALGYNQLPASLDHAVSLMEDSELVADTLGEEVFNFVLLNKRREWKEYRSQVTAYELESNLEIL